MLSACLLAMAALTPAAPNGESPLFRSELIFPPHPQHNHGSCIVETPKGDLLVCWYRGSGERRADDVAVLGARLRRGAKKWSQPFVMADTLGFPDTNPCMVIDPQRRLWLLWCTILDNNWESALLKVKTSVDYERALEPRWKTESVLHIKPGPEFQQIVERDLYRQWEPYRHQGTPEEQQKLETYLAERLKMATVKLTVRLGWMTRVHPTIIGKRMILPLYSDGFDFSLMAFTDDGGTTWQVSEPLVGPGNVQPSVVPRKDGMLVAFFRDNGPPPQRVLVSESSDNGRTWTLARDTDVTDTGAGVEAIVLKSGRWLLVNNDVEQGRHRLSVSVSEDEGRTWPITRTLEDDAPGPDAGSYSYPSMIQAQDGTIHVTYSYRPNQTNRAREGEGESIKHVQFNEAWLLEGVRR
jgi:predicted neuraminidase